MNRASGLALDAAGTSDGSNVQSEPYSGDSSQLWDIVEAEHTVSYHLTGGDAGPDSQIKYHREDLILSSVLPERAGYEFLGWGTSESGDPVYQPGDRYAADMDLSLYAIWGQTLPDLVLPSGLTLISEEAFMGGSFTYVKVPENCERIGKRAFADCRELRHISLPENVAFIAADAFEGVAEDMVIHGPEGSYAEFYALKYHFAFLAD